MIGGGSAQEAKHARKIKPIRENGNLLLCTLLFGNVAVNTILSIILAEITSGGYSNHYSLCFLLYL